MVVPNPSGRGQEATGKLERYLANDSMQRIRQSGSRTACLAPDFNYVSRLDNTMRRPILSILATLCCALSCTEPGANSKHPEALIVLPHAEHVQFSRKGEADQLSYTITAAYPAAKTIHQISASLVRRGWTPLEYDWLNPGQRSSRSRGWSSFSDATTNPTSYVFRWLGQWQDSNMNLVVYGFQYREHSDALYQKAPSNSKLFIFASYLPKDAAQAMMKWANEAIGKRKQ